MSDIQLIRRHSLNLAKAKGIAQKAADTLAEKYDLTSEWHGNTLRFHRQGVEGQMHVTASEIQLEVKLGFLLRAFKARLLEHIEQNFDTLLREQTGTPPAKKAVRKARR